MGLQENLRDVVHGITDQDITISDEGDAYDIHTYEFSPFELDLVKEELDDADYDYSEQTQHGTNVVRLRIPKVERDA